MSLDLTQTDTILEKLNSIKVAYDVPTILISECFMVYISRATTLKILKPFTSSFSNLIFTFYDLINPFDPFGEEMIENLKARNIKLNGIQETHNIDSQISRLKEVGFQEAEACDMVDYYQKYVDINERKRIEKLELFDEFEEFYLLQQHSCFGVGLILQSEFAYLSELKFK